MIVTPILFKGKILELVKIEANKSLNAKIEFDDVSLSLFRGFPALNVKISKLNLVGIDDFENDTLIKFNYLSANLNLKSVVFGDQIKINSIILDQPDIYVKVLKNGDANYDIVKEDSTSTDEPDVEEEDEDSSFAIALKKLKINDANIIYDDQESDLLAEIENLNFKLKGDLTEKLTSLDLLLVIDSLSIKAEGVQYINRANLSFDSEIEANMDSSIYTFKENLFKINEIELGFDGFVAMPDTTDINMDITFSAKKTEFKSVLSMIPAVYQKDFDGVETSGVFAFSGFAKGTLNDTSIPAFGVDLSVKNAWFQYPDLPQAVTDINIDIHIENPGNEDINIIDITKFHLAMAKNPVDFKLYMKTSANDVFLRGNINAALNLNTVEQFYPLEDMTLSGSFATNLNFKGNLSAIENEEYDKFDASGNLKITDMKTKMEDLPPITINNLDLEFSPQLANLKQFDAQIGKSDVQLNGTIDNIFQYVFSDNAIKANFNFNSKLFDANDFLAYNESEDTEEISSTPEDSEEGEISAFEIPENIDLTLNSNIEKAIYEKLEITEVIGLITLKNSTLSLDNLSMNLLKGSMNLSLSYNAQNYKNPFAELTFAMQNIDLVESYNSIVSIQKLSPIIKNCSGKISSSFHIDTYLDYNLNPVYNTMNGSGSIGSDNIAISDNKLFGILATLTQMDKYKNPALENINLQFEIENGNIEILPTEFMLAKSKASVEGVSNLNKTIDFQLGLTVPSNTATNLIDGLPFLNLPNEIEILAIIGGTIDNPKIDKFSSNVFEGTKKELSEAAKKYIAEAQARADKLIADAKAKKAKLVKNAQNKVNQITSAAKREADKLLADAKTQGDALIAKAKNPVAKEVARRAADKLYTEAKKQSDKKISEGNKKIKGLVTDASKEGDKKIRDAERESDNIVRDAETKAENM